MPNALLTQPLVASVRQDTQTPPKVHRKGLIRPVYKRRICRDGRAYVTVPYTIRGPLVVGQYDPGFPMDRDYWIARLTASVGRHDPDTHPTEDGTPSGQDIKVNVRRVAAEDDNDDQAILVSDARLRIAVDHHNDAINNEDDGPYSVDDFNLHHLDAGDQPYVDILQVGSGRPGTTIVVSMILVPIP